ELAAGSEGTTSAQMRAQVQTARARQRERFGAGSGRLNARMTSRQLRKFCVLDEPGKELLRTAMESLGLSARAHDRILRMARTIADLDGADNLQERHVSEAIGYRSLDRKLWKRRKCERIENVLINQFFWERGSPMPTESTLLPSR